MGKLRYMLKRITTMNYGAMLKTAKEVSRETKRNRFIILIDIIKCGSKYMAGYVDYKVFKMYNLNDEQRKTYITRGINNRYVEYLNDKEIMKNTGNKLYFNKHHGRFLKREWICLEDVLVEDFIKFTNKHKTFIVKPIDESCGHGVEKITVDENTNLEELYNDLKEHNQILVEECIVQNEKMSSLNPTSVNTIRVVTLKKQDGSVVVLFVGLRMGNKGKSVDNFNNDGLFTVVSDDGIVRKLAVDKKGNVYDTHPATGTKIIGFEIPNFDKAINVAKECAKEIDGLRYIGFDVVVTKDDALILEANPFPGHDLYQSEVHLEKDLKGLREKFDKEIYG